MSSERSVRYKPASAAIGTQELECVRKARMLVVGAGGIGCELLKNLVLTGVGYIEVVRLSGPSHNRLI